MGDAFGCVFADLASLIQYGYSYRQGILDLLAV
jgi:hypothetical protein